VMKAKDDGGADERRSAAGKHGVDPTPPPA
jgi:hypothetical protein